MMGTSTAAPERHHCRRPLREEWELDEGEGRGGGGGGETVSKMTIAAKTVENGEDSDDGYFCAGMVVGVGY